MRRKLPWPFIIVIITSFLFGAIWGWKLIHDRELEEGRLEVEAKLQILAPPGVFSREILLEFQRREKIEVDVTVEAFPAALLRRALKSAPGQYDAVILYHHQVSALRTERKLAALFDSRVKFPTMIAPDFRKLPNDRNLMDTAPLMWGVLGLASKKEFESIKPQMAFWPASLIGLEDIGVTPAAFAGKIQTLYSGFDEFETHMKSGPGGFTGPADAPVVVSHGSLAFSPLKEQNLSFTPLRIGDRAVFPLWILTAAALADGDIERTRKFVRFLLEPAQNISMVQTVRAGATTLREQPGLETLPANLQASFFRTIPIDEIILERDERVRTADEVLEQLTLGAHLKAATKRKEPQKEAGSVPAVSTPKVRAKPKPVVVKETVDAAAEEAAEGAATSAPPSEERPVAPPTAPSEETAHDG